MPAHFALPFTLRAGQFATVEQDSDADITACIMAVLRQRIGVREDRPEIGIPDPVHLQEGIDLEVLNTAIATFEPRAHRVLSRNPALLATILDQILISAEGATK